MEMKVEIVEEDPKLHGVVIVRVPGIYGRKGNPLPKGMSRLTRGAAEALQRVFEQVVNEGGHLYLSDMFRSAVQQQKAHEDWKSGRKSAFSPPSCSSVHEAARAIDIDAFDTAIGHKRVREILNRYGWVHIVDTLTGPECWHYEFREPRWETFKDSNGYPAMARAMKQEIGNVVGAARADAKIAEIKRLQEAFNQILSLALVVDGMYGEATKEACREFQRRHGLQVDGIAGPITMRTINEVLASLE